MPLIIDLDVASHGLSAIEASPPAAVSTATVETLQAPAGLGAKMSEVTAAGFELAKRVLLIMTASIVLLLAYLVWSDCNTQSGLGRSYSDLLARSGGLEPISNPERLDAWQAALRAAAADQSATASASEQKASRELIDALGQNFAISARQEKALGVCIDLAKTASDRAAALDECLDILGLIKKAQNTASTNTGLVARVSKDLGDQIQANHTFWTQMAQLLLLNLLLPLLTGLFGYIFGTHQQAQSAG